MAPNRNRAAIQGLYEMQVLDNYKSETYPDGMAGAIYGQYPPLVNACRPQGEWQTYNIIFMLRSCRMEKSSSLHA